MIIPTEELFDNTVFKFNADMVVETIDTSITKVTVIDDFYEDIDSVLKQIEKLPIAKVWGKYPLNNKIFFDGRKVYANNMDGSQLPYTEDGLLNQKVSEIIGYDPENISIDNKLLVNCFRFTDELNLEENYYSAHVDDYTENSPGQVAIVVFLNRHYEEGEGMNFYEDAPEWDENHITPKDSIELVATIQGKCNRAVLFDSKFPHGQSTPTDQFRKEMRYTQVIFLPLW